MKFAEQLFACRRIFQWKQSCGKAVSKSKPHLTVPQPTATVSRLHLVQNKAVTEWTTAICRLLTLTAKGFTTDGGD